MSFPVITAEGGEETVPSQKETAFLCTAERALCDLLTGGLPPAVGTPALSVRAAGGSNGWQLGRAWRLSLDTGGWTDSSVGYFCLQVF